MERSSATVKGGAARTSVQAQLCDLLRILQDTVKYCMRNHLHISLPLEGVVTAGLYLMGGLGA